MSPDTKPRPVYDDKRRWRCASVPRMLGAVCTRGIESGVEDGFVHPRACGLVAALALVCQAAERATAARARTARRVAGHVGAQAGKADVVGFAEGGEGNQPRRQAHHGRRLGRKPG
eukprot:scaffold6303_cov75-Phaeocystis_antarctica.AAC.4